MGAVVAKLPNQMLGKTVFGIAWADLAVLALSLASLALFALFTTTLRQAYLPDNAGITVCTALSVGFAVLFAWVKFDTAIPLVTMLTRSSAAGLCFYLLVEPPDFTLVNPEAAPLLAYVDAAYWPAVAAAALGLWRPSFIIPAANYVMSTRALIEPISGYIISTHDIQYLVEMGQYLSICVVAIASFQAFAQRISKPGHPAQAWTAALPALQTCFAFNAIAFHLGNYFWSGFAKMAIGPRPLSWVTDNPTQNTVLIGLEKGTMPLGHITPLVDFTFEALSTTAPLTNAFVLCIQLGAIIALFRVSWLIWTSIAYDVLHIVIYVAAGVFFWPWIWINVAILYALRRARRLRVPMIAKLSCLLCIILGAPAAPIFDMHFALLGWYDADAVKSARFQAQAPDGRWIDIPTAFFNSHSYTISHGYMDLATQAKHYPPARWASVNYHHYAHVKNCAAPAPLPGVALETADEFADRRDRARRFIRAHHAKVLQRVDDQGRYNPYLRSHHHPSNPWLYRDFNALDLRQVTAYRLLSQSVCLSLDNGDFQRAVQHEDIIHIPLEGL